MLIKLGKTGRNIRLFQKVETVDNQYDIRDIGIEHEDGGIDSLVVGGSFYSLKKVIANADAEARESRQVVTAAPAVQGVVLHPVTMTTRHRRSLLSEQPSD